MVAARLEKNKTGTHVSSNSFRPTPASKRYLPLTKIEVIRMTEGEWLFQCPECNVSHHEMACFAGQQTVRLHRWIELPEKTDLAAAD
jgi:hypothetical protein